MAKVAFSKLGIKKVNDKVKNVEEFKNIINSLNLK